MKCAKKQNISDRFNPLIDGTDSSVCWPFKGTLDNDGYGKFVLEPDCLAHRVAYRLFIGDIPDGKQVLHKCDNPACCNPRHLFLGTASDNMKDMWAKNRHPRPIGEKNNHAKLTKSSVLTIRDMYASGKYHQKDLAKLYHVSQALISAIITRRNWTHI